MSSQPSGDDDLPAPQRPPSPPLHTTPGARGIVYPAFSSFRPRDVRFTSSHGMSHVAWSCDGKRLAAVGIDKSCRVWIPETSLDARQATTFSGGHTDDVDYVSWNPAHAELFCTSSQRDRRVVFWDTRQSRNIQTVSLKYAPIQTQYAPNGRSLLYITSGHNLFFLDLGQSGSESKDSWRLSDKEHCSASTASFNHAGDGLVLTHSSEHNLRILDYPSFVVRETPAAHVGGCQAVALDPRGRYLASGGKDSIINMFDTSEWIVAKTISTSDHSINALSFSFDGEYLAIASGGSYIDICATETCAPLHRVPALAPAPTVTWHPSKYVVAYCGQIPQREGGPSPAALVSLYGPGLSG